MASQANTIIQVLDTAYPSSLLDMSSDPFADLASSTEAFAREFREFMTRNPRPAPGSPADKEARGEPFGGDWGEHPSSDIFATTYLTATSCTDHLLGLADVLNSRNALFAAYTLTRGAVEAAAVGCYLTDQDIDGRERVRRTMNYRLDAMCERTWLFMDMQGDYAAEKLNETKQRIASFARGAHQHGFAFRHMNGKGRAACIGSEQPKAMALISFAVDKDMPQLGRTYQRLLSATAHSSVRGLARMLAPVSPNEGRPGEALAAVNIDPRTLAVGTGCRAADGAQPCEAHRVVHRLRYDRALRSREPDALDLVAYRPDEDADGATRPVRPLVDIAKLSETVLFNLSPARLATPCRSLGPRHYALSRKVAVGIYAG